MSQKLLPIMSPLFNLREACKHLALLEDHLNSSYKRCPDCIRKHFLTLEGLFEEAVSLENGDMADLYEEHAELMRKLAQAWSDGEKPRDVAEVLRVVRKRLTPFCFDLSEIRTASRNVVASVWLGRQRHFH